MGKWPLEMPAGINPRIRSTIRQTAHLHGNRAPPAISFMIVAGRNLIISALSESGFVSFAGTDAHRLLDRHDEDLAIADFPGLGRDGDGIDGLVGLSGRHNDLDLEFRNEVYDI